MGFRGIPCRGIVIEQPCEGNKEVMSSKIVVEHTNWDNMVEGASRALEGRNEQRRCMKAKKVTGQRV
jgi:hypothetical protein